MSQDGARNPAGADQAEGDDASPRKRWYRPATLKGWAELLGAVAGVIVAVTALVVVFVPDGSSGAAQVIDDSFAENLVQGADGDVVQQSGEGNTLNLGLDAEQVAEIVGKARSATSGPTDVKTQAVNECVDQLSFTFLKDMGWSVDEDLVRGTCSTLHSYDSAEEAFEAHPDLLVPLCADGVTNWVIERYERHDPTLRELHPRVFEVPPDRFRAMARAAGRVAAEETCAGAR